MMGQADVTHFLKTDQVTTLLVSGWFLFMRNIYTHTHTHTHRESRQKQTPNQIVLSHVHTDDVENTQNVNPDSCTY